MDASLKGRCLKKMSDLTAYQAAETGCESSEVGMCLAGLGNSKRPLS